MSVLSIGGKHARRASPMAAGRGKRRRSKSKSKKPLAIASAALAGIVGLYCLCVFSSIPFIAKWRTLYIETAMSTMSHQWLATAFIPSSIIDRVLTSRYESDAEQADMESSWDVVFSNPLIVTGSGEEGSAGSGVQAGADSQDTPLVLTQEQEELFTLFDELDRQSLVDYVDGHPEAVENGWLSLKFNEAAIDSDGTQVTTVQGHKVMAMDAQNGILILRVKSDTYRGVLAIIKDPAQVSVANASTLGDVGQFAHEYASDLGALVVMGANGFEDEGGVGNGGTIYGLSIASGQSAGTAGGAGYKRAEIREDGHMYVVNSETPVASDTRDAAEFKPALIMDGQQLITDSAGWGIQPRSIIAQGSDLSIMMLVVEGRQGVSNIGITLGECADILMDYGAVQAMNMDGGSTAILVYEGEPVTMCSNGYIYGRTLPNAFVAMPKED